MALQRVACFIIDIHAGMQTFQALRGPLPSVPRRENTLAVKVQNLPLCTQLVEHYSIFTRL
eukprot:416977-Pelagomonas_calceolata.AAC.1